MKVELIKDKAGLSKGTVVELESQHANSLIRDKVAKKVTEFNNNFKSKKNK